MLNDNPPPQNPIIVNCDASVSNGVAAVARNPDDRLVAVRISKKIINVPEAAEAYAILKAIQWAIEEDWVNLTCISDAKTVIQCLVNKNPSGVHWSAQGFILSIIGLLSSLNCVVFCWTPRSSNRAAHCVCKWGLKFSICGTFSPYALPVLFDIQDHLAGS